MFRADASEVLDGWSQVCGAGERQLNRHTRQTQKDAPSLP